MSMTPTGQTQPAATSLQERLDQHGDPVEMMRNAPTGAYIYPVVAPEFTNWRDEVVAWRESAVMFDQTHYMDNLIIRVPEAKKLLSDTELNSLVNFPVNRDRQYVPVKLHGNVIGDDIIFHEAEEKFTYVVRAPVTSWLMFQVQYSN